MSNIETKAMGLRFSNGDILNIRVLSDSIEYKRNYISLDYVGYDDTTDKDQMHLDVYLGNLCYAAYGKTLEPVEAYEPEINEDSSLDEFFNADFFPKDDGKRVKIVYSNDAGDFYQTFDVRYFDSDEEVDEWITRNKDMNPEMSIISRQYV